MYLCPLFVYLYPLFHCPPISTVHISMSTLPLLCCKHHSYICPLFHCPPVALLMYLCLLFHCLPVALFMYCIHSSIVALFMYLCPLFHCPPVSTVHLHLCPLFHCLLHVPVSTLPLPSVRQSSCICVHPSTAFL